MGGSDKKSLLTQRRWRCVGGCGTQSPYVNLFCRSRCILYASRFNLKCVLFTCTFQLLMLDSNETDRLEYPLVTMIEQIKVVFTPANINTAVILFNVLIIYCGAQNGLVRDSCGPQGPKIIRSWPGPIAPAAYG